MLVVDSQKRASLDEVANHSWLKEAEEEEETVPLPAISNVEEIAEQELEIILRRMEQGGYGTMEAILRYVAGRGGGAVEDGWKGGRGGGARTLKVVARGD